MTKKTGHIDLLDPFGRKHDYLRMSITDSCNFRCLYCMPDEPFKSSVSSEMMNAEEIFEIAKVFTSRFGIRKIRLTGGEPLVRNDITTILTQLSTLGAEICLTTNGVLLDRHFSTLQVHGINHLNISIDSLDREKFKYITKRDFFEPVWASIKEAVNLGFYVKLNVVVMMGFNDNELVDFVRLSAAYPVDIRFIEFMPFSGNDWERKKVITQGEMMEIIQRDFNIDALEMGSHDTARKFKVSGGSSGTFGFISTMSNAFCAGCNRIRITADGKLKNCLFGAEEFDLLTAYRNQMDLHGIIQEAIRKKHKEKGGQFDKINQVEEQRIQNRSMIRIGG